MGRFSKTSINFGDKLFSLVVVCLGFLVIYGSSDLVVWDDFGPGGRLAPLLTAGLLIIFGTANLFSQSPPVPLPDKKILKNMIFYGALLLVCIWLFTRIGAIAAFMVFLVFELVLVEKYSPLRACGIAIITMAVMYMIFSVGLQLRLPQFPYFRL